MSLETETEIEGEKNGLQLFRTTTLKGGLKGEGPGMIINYLNKGIMVHTFRESSTVLHSFIHRKSKKDKRA